MFTLVTCVSSLIKYMFLFLNVLLLIVTYYKLHWKNSVIWICVYINSPCYPFYAHNCFKFKSSSKLTSTCIMHVSPIQYLWTRHSCYICLCVFSVLILVYIHCDFHFTTVNSAGCFALLRVSWHWFWYQKMNSTDVSMSLAKYLACANMGPLRLPADLYLEGLAFIDYAYSYDQVFFQVFIQLIYRCLLCSTKQIPFSKLKRVMSFHYFYLPKLGEMSMKAITMYDVTYF